MEVKEGERKIGRDLKRERERKTNTEILRNTSAAVRKMGTFRFT